MNIIGNSKTGQYPALQVMRAFVVACAAVFVLAAATAQAQAETRTLKLFFIHTKEKAEITYKRNGKYIQSGLTQINRFLRDWRRNEPTKMDPRLLDLVWEAYRRSGGRDYIHVVSAYRSPATNSMLRKRSKGVAEKSQHMLGRAMDFYIPGVKLSRLRAEALKLQGGGVGYYPRSGAPFVHMDVGSVRHWPRMSRSELVAVFPNGNTLHVPTDGKPLPGYDQALASYQSRKKSGGSIQIASDSGSSAKRSGGGNFLANLFRGGGADEEEDNGEVEVAVAKAEPRTREPQRAAPAPKGGEALPGVATSAAPPARVEAAPEPEAPKQDNPETIIASLPARSIPLPFAAPRPGADVAPTVVAAVAETAAPVPGRRPDGGATIALASAAPSVESMIAENDDYDSTLAAFAPLPGSRPEGGPMGELIAAIPQSRPGKGDRVTALQASDVAAPVMVASIDPATARSAVRAKQGDAAGALEGARTTEKAGKPSSRDGKPDPRPVVLPVARSDAQWVMEAAASATRAVASAKTPSLAHQAIWQAPKKVYVAGFQSPDATQDATRFSGNAVTFLAVAKFD